MKFVLDYRSPPSGFGQILNENDEPILNLTDEGCGFHTSIPNLFVPEAFENETGFKNLVEVLVRHGVTEVRDSELMSEINEDWMIEDYQSLFTLKEWAETSLMCF